MEQNERGAGRRRYSHPPRRSRFASYGAREKSSGLVTRIYGRDRMVCSRQEICDDLLRSLPKLHTALRSSPPTNEQLWKRTSNGSASVSTFELVGVPPEAGEDGSEVQYAVAASTLLNCHLNEVLNVLVSPNSSEYEATMKSLLGRHFEGGEVLYHEQCDLRSDDSTNGGQVLLGVQMAVLRPSLLHLVPKSVCYPDQHTVQRLCFQSLTHRYPGTDRAVHVMKTLPKRIHDQIVPEDCCSALSRDIDHLGIAFDIESMPVDVTTGQRQLTRVFAHAYAASHPLDGLDQHFPALELCRGHVRARTSPEYLQQTTPRVVNSEARHVLQLLTHQLSEFERVIKRRRLGFQSFIYFPPSINSAGKEKNGLPLCCVCVSCLKSFTLFRREFYCQICGHLVCADCSQFYEVEARAGEVRKNRVCLHCVHRVDSCVFANEDLVAALGPAIVPVRRSSEWSQRFESDELDTDDDDENEIALAAELSSGGPIQRFEGLAQLGKLLIKAKQRHRAKMPPPTRPRVKFTLPPGAEEARHALDTGVSDLEAAKNRVQNHLESYVNRLLIDAQQKYSLDNLETASLMRNYRYAFDARKTTYEGLPLPPIPTRAQEALRLHHIQASGILEPEYDHSALDLIAQVAAKRLECPIGFISLVDDSIFHSVGTYPPRNFGLQAPRVESMCSHTVYADKPLIIKNAQCDLRFAQMLVVRDHGVRFYAGFPIRAPDGSIVASLCASDRVPHNNISAADYAIMQTLATVAAQLIAPSNRVLSIPQQPKVHSDAISRVQQNVRNHDPSRRRGKLQLKLQNSKSTMIDWK